jgi:hypothetical protein
MKSPLGVQVKAFQRGPSNGGASEGANGFIVRNVILEKVYRMCDALITSKPDLPVSRSLFSAFSDPAPSISLSLSLSLFPSFSLVSFPFPFTSNTNSNTLSSVDFNGVQWCE